MSELASGAATTGSTDRRQARREELLDAAIRVIRRQGDQAAMESIAAEAGISRPILYRHFGDVTGLYAAVADRFCQAVLARLQGSVEEVGAGRALVHRQISVYLSFVAADPNVYLFLIRQAPSGRRRLGSRRSGFSRMVAAWTADFLREAGWEPAMAKAAGDLLVGGLEFAAERWVEDPSEPWEQVAENLTTLLWNGYAPIARSVEPGDGQG